MLSVRVELCGVVSGVGSWGMVGKRGCSGGLTGIGYEHEFVIWWGRVRVPGWCGRRRGWCRWWGVGVVGESGV